MVGVTGISICCKKVVKDFWDVHFFPVAVEGRIVNSNMNGFSSFPHIYTSLVICVTICSFPIIAPWSWKG